MNIRYWSIGLLALTILYTNSSFGAEDHDHATEVTIVEHSDNNEKKHNDDQGHDEEGRVHLNKEQRRSAGIVVESLTARSMPTEIEAPGEIRLNAYASSQVSPRIEAQVLERHARLGNRVSQGQPLVTLSSVSMSDAQGELLVAAKEWQRIRKLGKTLVSEKQHLESQIAYQQAHARLLAYGMTPMQTKQLINENNISRADGSFTLLSPQDGTVIQDDFLVGQMMEPGELLFELTDESSLWVQVRIKPDSVSHLSIGAPARVFIGDTWIDARVIQIYHSLDETTRTLPVRLEISNPNDRIHPGQFVTARIQTDDSGEPAFTMPLDAVLRSPDGDWQVFVEEKPGEFEPREVDLVRQLPELAVIEGLAPGVRVVTQGAFFIQSELAKSGFDIHNH